MPQADQKAVLTQARRDTRRRLQTMLADYDPDTEAVVVTITLERVHLLHINLAGRMFAETDHKRIPHRLQAPVKLPPAVRLEKVPRPDGSVAYTYTHEQWGLLGRIVAGGHGAGQTTYRVEPAADALSHPNYRRKLQLFETLAQEIEQKFFATLRQSPPRADGRPGTAQTVKLAKLYAAFMNIPNDFEMAQFVQRLSAGHLQYRTESSVHGYQFHR